MLNPLTNRAAFGPARKNPPPSRQNSTPRAAQATVPPKRRSATAATGKAERVSAAAHRKADIRTAGGQVLRQRTQYHLFGGIMSGIQQGDPHADCFQIFMVLGFPGDQGIRTGSRCRMEIVPAGASKAGTS